MRPQQLSQGRVRAQQRLRLDVALQDDFTQRAARCPPESAGQWHLVCGNSGEGADLMTTMIEKTKVRTNHLLRRFVSSLLPVSSDMDCPHMELIRKCPLFRDSFLKTRSFEARG